FRDLGVRLEVRLCRLLLGEGVGVEVLNVSHLNDLSSTLTAVQGTSLRTSPRTSSSTSLGVVITNDVNLVVIHNNVALVEVLNVHCGGVALNLSGIRHGVLRSRDVRLTVLVLN